MSGVGELFAGTEHIVGQVEARKKLAVSFDRQQMVRDGDLDAAHGVLVPGPSGVGKTALTRSMAALSGLPFAEANATQFSEAGYVGLDLVMMFQPLIVAAIREQLRHQRQESLLTGEALPPDRVDELTKLPTEILEAALEDAATGVVLLDEFDKWVAKGADDKGRNPGVALMAELLKMIEGGEVYIRGPEDEIGIPFNTARVQIIGAGAFVGLNKIVAQRMARDPEEIRPGEVWEAVIQDDLESFGLIPELVGRLSTVVPLRPLNENDMLAILNHPKGLVHEYEERFARVGCHLVVADGALASLSRVAMLRRTGARALRQVFEEILTGALFDASIDDTEGECLLTSQSVDHKRAVYRAVRVA